MSGHGVFRHDRRAAAFVVLSWKQAFDSIDHTAMGYASRSFGTPEDCLHLLGSIYSDPTFEATGLNGRVATGEVAAGVRRGVHSALALSLLSLRLSYRILISWYSPRVHPVTFGR